MSITNRRTPIRAAGLAGALLTVVACGGVEHDNEVATVELEDVGLDDGPATAEFFQALESFESAGGDAADDEEAEAQASGERSDESRRPTETCSQGNLAGFWYDRGENPTGRFFARWSPLRSGASGVVQGRYTTAPGGAQVFAARIATRSGVYLGMIRGRWQAGSIAGDYTLRSGETGPVRGQYTRGETPRRPGRVAARWTANCSDDDRPDPRPEPRPRPRDASSDDAEDRDS